MFQLIEHERVLNAQRVILIIALFFLFACNSKPVTPTLFEVLDYKKTGLNFTNKLTNTDSFNMFKYMYFYNGAGVGAGDFNNDGLVDLFFSSNQGQNKLYLNQDKLQFKDYTKEAQIPTDGGWSTGVSVVDINNDGLLDIYVCKVGNFETLRGKNELLVCQKINDNGTPVYIDKAKEYGLDFSGFSTQAAFLDYDMDGDLDMFLLNHSVHQNGTFGERKNFLGTYHPLSGDRIYRNDGKRFTDVTKSSGINSSAIGYGLGLAVADINLDGYADLYVGNDFHENDYLYINQKDATFKDELNEKIEHTSQFSMGVDIADINNDAFPEIISMDMLPSDPYILKRSLGEDDYNIFTMKRSYGYNHQYSRNGLQLNRKNGMFSEVAMYAGVDATDWSWAPLWVDFDNDGLKDLFISNGIPKRLNDMDYVNYVSNDEVQKMINENKIDKKELAVINKFPEIKLPNKFFKNNGDVTFSDLADNIKGDKPTYSNGSVYADFDNDGDLDIVSNNIDEQVSFYENKTNDSASSYLQVNFKGPANNIKAVGAKIIVFAKRSVRTYDKYPVKGFQSSMEIPLLVGLNNSIVDSMLLVWPDNTFQRIEWKKGITNISFTYKEGLPKFDYSTLTQTLPNTTNNLEDITRQTQLRFKHEENPFNEFDREPLIPFMVSREGPALSVGDVNGDGLDDVFIGSAKNNKGAVFIQTASGIFQKTSQPAIDNDSTFEDVDACWADVNKDGFIDLVVASGGNEFYGKDEHLLPRVYINNGTGKLSKLTNAFQGISLTASCVVASDFNNDGFVDLFIGGRTVPFEYGQAPRSYLLENDKSGHFKDVTSTYCKELIAPGFVKHAIWSDLDKDGDQDLVVALEWDGIVAFINNNGTFQKTILTNKKGWWNFTLPVDVDGDGDIDLIAGNLGLNNQLKASELEPVKLYYNDFDGNGKKEQVLTYFLQHREIPFANKDELQKQMPIIKKRFLYAADFAKASLNEIFSKDKLNDAAVLTTNDFSNVVLINDGKMNFTEHRLPWQAQLSSYKDAVIVNANNDNLPDILLAGNFYENNIQIGRNDADCGTLLINKGKGNFVCENLNGLIIKGQVRRIKKIRINKREAFILARNNDSAMVVSFNSPINSAAKK
jgi:hypothetical protein